MGAGRAEAGKINCFAAHELGADVRDPRIGKFRTELVKARSAKGFRCQPSRGTESARGEPRVLRTNSFVGVQMRRPWTGRVLPCINHNWRRATILFHLTE